MIVHADILDWATSYDGPLFHALLFALAVRPFATHMARGAKCNQIVERIGQPMIGEISESADVMHWQRLAVLLFGYTAVLAGIVVTYASGPALRAPVWTIVALITTAPRWIAHAAQCDVGTQMRAKAAFVSYTNLRSRSLHILTAYFAVPLNPLNALRSMLAVWSWFTLFVWLLYLALDDAERPAFVEAGTRADRRVFCVMQSAWLCGKRNCTNRAFDRDAPIFFGCS